MIPEENREDVIQSGIIFMRSITEAFGSKEGLKLWDTIADTLDPDVKGQIFFAMVTGNFTGAIRVTGVRQGYDDIVGMIKTIRSISGWGLKESKDAIDALRQSGKHFSIDCQESHRAANVHALRVVGLIC